jgi:hypothetical protein
MIDKEVVDIDVGLVVEHVFGQDITSVLERGWLQSTMLMRGRHTQHKFCVGSIKLNHGTPTPVR